MFPEVRLVLPDWVAEEVGDPSKRYGTLEERMDLAIRLSDRNVAEGTGGPFGACVVETGSGALVSVGVNMVVPARCSVAHAEAVSIMVAQQVSRVFDLGAQGLPRMDLVTSAQPCVQCFGMIWWSGISRLIFGATREDVETLAGFDEGPLPVDWVQRLASRPPLPPVDVVEDCLRDQARQVLRRYRGTGGIIYRPGSGKAK